MPIQPLLSFVVAGLLTTIKQCSAVAVKSANAEDFAALCGLITLAKANPQIKAEPQDIADSIRSLIAINYTIGDAAIRADVAADKTKDWTAVSAKHTGHKAYYSKHWEEWRRVENLDPSDAEAKALLLWHKHRNNNEVKQKVRMITETAIALQEAAQQVKEELKAEGLSDDLEGSLYGAGKAEATIKFAGADRETECGKGATNAAAPGTKEGHALYWDLLCLCAGEATDDDAGGACCDGCGTAHNGDPWRTNTEGKTRAEKIAEHCPPYLIPETLSQTLLTSRLLSFLSRANKHKGTGRAEKFVLGYMDGSGTNGCTGKTSAGDTGACVKYAAGSILKNDPELQWLTHLKQAVTKSEKQLAAEKTLRELAAKLKILNNSAEQILYTTSYRNSETGTAAKASSAAPAAICTQYTTNETCISNKCKWEGKTETTGAHCKPGDNQVTGHTNTAETGKTPKEGAAANGCAAHGTDKTKFEGDKSCKWEGETCKDFSFLMN
ncbi:Trypanosomal VSG domain/Trypanosome variant surface glycoprotein C-terminal domain containing protein, putative [Trypanosoma equiperdum]|uniref:Trypanosomal VSG domain/Trypanosome variant surface glycoprotein C-terminal domain containing protein, putative n=1 Tax=Trypanosoma equiperdum TaxID=5694 RepID=A0A1G4I290_TRYEQ|nr:Trypanosomal VSG domain/Trypanosome variant surface glycoprotein C-terminal domain containing protein, putative [Trypanosoma equiperdum]